MLTSVELDGIGDGGVEGCDGGVGSINDGTAALKTKSERYNPIQRYVKIYIYF